MAAQINGESGTLNLSRIKNAAMGAMVSIATGIYTENAIHFSLILGSNKIVRYVKNGNRGNM